MASGQTEWYGLSLWESGDSFLREEFNEDHRRIDEGLAGKCEVVFGAYTGDGTAIRDIRLGFRPRAVLVTDDCGRFNDSGGTRYGGLVLDGTPTVFGGAGDHMAVIDAGFRVYQWENYTNSAVNRRNQTYHYLALKAS